MWRTEFMSDMQDRRWKSAIECCCCFCSFSLLCFRFFFCFFVCRRHQYTGNGKKTTKLYACMTLCAMHSTKSPELGQMTIAKLLFDYDPCVSTVWITMQRQHNYLLCIIRLGYVSVCVALSTVCCAPIHVQCIHVYTKHVCDCVT